MSDLNLCQFIGHLGRDPEVRYMPNGDAVCNLSVGVGWKTKDKSGTEWVRCNAFGKLAEICGQYLKKGKQVYVAGAMSTREWTDKDGVKKFTTEVRLNQMQMLGSKDGAARQDESQPEKGEKVAPTSFDNMDDDIPF